MLILNYAFRYNITSKAIGNELQHRKTEQPATLGPKQLNSPRETHRYTATP